MTEFEDQLRKALARKEPAEGFTARTLAKIASGERRPQRAPWWSWVESWKWLAPVAAALVVLVSVSVYRQHERDEQGQLAKQKLMMAMKLTSVKLQETQHRVMQIGDYRGDSADNPTTDSGVINDR